MESVERDERRVLQLEGGSNFRDLGGYATGDGRETQWRRVYRSGALGQLTEADTATLDDIGIDAVLDLRCRAESELMPGRWTTPERHYVDYATELVFAKALGSESMDLYSTFPQLLSPHLSWLFGRLLEHDGPVVIHCSGGQDRTGVVAGVLLAALGVRTEQIVEDYMLTTRLRRRANEIDLKRVSEMADSNPVAAFYARVVAERGPEALDPRPLLDHEGRPKVLRAFEAIDERWGDLDRYLDEACRLDAPRRARLQDVCLTDSCS